MPKPEFNPRLIEDMPGQIWYVQDDQANLIQKLTLPDLQAEFVMMLPRDYQGIKQLTLSPDGQQIVYLYSDLESWKIHAVNLDQNSETKLIELDPEDALEKLILLPGLNPAGPMLVVSGAQSWKLLLLNKRHQQDCLAEFESSAFDGGSIDTAHRRILLQTQKKESEPPDFFWLDLSNYHLEPISPAPLFHRLWFRPEISSLWIGPLGQSYAFQTENQNDLYLAQIEQPRKQQVLKKFGSAKNMVWSPCENWLARPGAEGLVVTQIKTGQQTLLPRLQKLRALAWTL